MMSAPRLTINGAAAALRAREITAVKLAAQALRVAEQIDEEYGLFVKTFGETTMLAAAAVDAQLEAGEHVGALAGIPLGVKDIISTVEAPTTGQSLVLGAGWSQGDAVVVQRLRAAGALIVGKLTTAELALGPPDLAKPFPVPRNPWDRSRWTGGSSSGSAGAVAAGAVLGALGTDTGGSIRVPAAYCGITGLKPTFGRVPRSGCLPLAPTLDHIGPMAATARDCATLLAAMAGYHPSDPSSLDAPVDDYAAAMGGTIAGLRIGVDRLKIAADHAQDPAVAAAFDATLEIFESLGAELVEIELPLYEDVSAACIAILASEALAYHLPNLQTRWDDFFSSTRARLVTGLFYSGADYVQAQRVRRAGAHQLKRVYDNVDLILTPTVSGGAPTLEDVTATMGMLASTVLDTVHTPYWDAVGNPVLSLPIGFTSDGMPLGAQLAGRPLDESRVLHAADAYQRVTDWHKRQPPLDRPDTSLALNREI